MLDRYEISNNMLLKSTNGGNVYHYYNVTSEEKKELINTYALDAHTVTSALDPDEIPRLEFENDRYILICNIPTSLKLTDTSLFNILSVGLVLFKDKLLIISTESNEYLKEKNSLPITSLHDALLAYLDNATKHFVEHLKIIRLMSREIQKKLNKSVGNEYLLQMFNLSETLVYYLDAIDGNKVILNKLYESLKSKNIPVNFSFFNDLIIENNQASKQAEIYSTVFAGLMDARGSIVNNNMTALIKRLTMINIIFLPLNLIASVGGMSEFSMMTRGVHWAISFGVLIIVFLMLGWLMFRLINKLEHPSSKTRAK